MTLLAPLLVDVWREVGRHLEIEASSRSMLDVLRRDHLVPWVLVRRWDEVRSRLDTVASEGVVAGTPLRSVAPTPRAIELARWAAERQATSWHSRAHAALARFLVPEGVDGPFVAVPLGEGRLDGVLLLGGRDAALAAQLMEPWSVALENDRRLHELARLREAAESDRQALLQRLGRQDMDGAIIGAEAGLREVMARVGQVAPTDAPVLILGETGSGKEVVARALHARSRRASGPFLRVNCGAIPSELVDSELFGHEKGAFTGALAQRRGWFERADGGTLFLDEVAELPAAAQVRLLRVLQDGLVTRVGGEEPHTVDVRIVAATHRDMGALVREGGFRQDLWYRVSVFPIVLPALRERRDDIVALAAHFAEAAGRRLYGRPLTPSPDDIASLRAYGWPGNVRELASVIERAAILGAGQRLLVQVALGGAQIEASEDPIRDALARCRGRIEGPFGAAQALGVNPHTLRARLRKLGVDWTVYRTRHNA